MNRKMLLTAMLALAACAAPEAEEDAETGAGAYEEKPREAWMVGTYEAGAGSNPALQRLEIHSVPTWPDDDKWEVVFSLHVGTIDPNGRTYDYERVTAVIEDPQYQWHRATFKIGTCDGVLFADWDRYKTFPQVAIVGENCEYAPKDDPDPRYEPGDTITHFYRLEDLNDDEGIFVDRANQRTIVHSLGLVTFEWKDGDVLPQRSYRLQPRTKGEPPSFLLRPEYEISPCRVKLEASKEKPAQKLEVKGPILNWCASAYEGEYVRWRP